MLIQKRLRHTSHLAIALAGLAPSIIMAAPALAQADTDAEVRKAVPSSVVINETAEIVVTGVRAGLEKSLDAKRIAVSVVDTISSEDIGKFPDNNVAEALQRIPGVTIDRSELGEGRQINLRGLGGGFARSEINGGFAVNGLDFGVIAPELFNRITVEKSISASTVEGGLSGTIKTETVKPFDSEGTRVIGVAGLTIGQKAKTVPRLFGLISKNWDDQFGFVVGLAYSKIDFRTNEVAYGPWVPFRRIANATALANSPVSLLDASTPRTSAYYSYIERRDNIGATAAVQGRMSDNFSFTADLLYAQADGARNDDRPDIPIEGGNSAPSAYTLDGDVVTSATFNGVQNRVGTSFRPQFQRVYQGGLRAEWNVSDRFTVRPGIAYAKRRERNELHLFSFAINNTTVNYAINGDMPNFSSTATDFISNPEDFGFNVFIFDRFRQTTDEFMGKVDAQFTFDDSGDNNLEFGVRYTDRSTDRAGEFAGIFQGNPLIDPLSSAPNLSAVMTTRKFYVGGSPSQTPSRILAVDPEMARQTFYPNVGDPFVAPEFFPYLPGNIARSFTVGETTLAGYAQANFVFGDVAFNAGVRVVETETKTSGAQLVGSVVTPRTDEGSYVNWLPAANLRYTVMDGMVLRAAAGRTMTRPDLDALTPTQFINSGPRTGTRGNPNLKPFVANQLDLSFEYYWHQGSLLNVGFFAKDLKTLITQSVVNEPATFPDQLTGELVTESVAFTQPSNGDKATVKGLEVGLQTPFYFLPGMLSNFGAVLNYTHATSKATVRAGDGSVRSTPLPGLSSNSYNAALYYDNGKGLDARLAYAWRSTYLRADPVGAQFGGERYIRSYGQLDFSSSIPITDNFQLGLDVTNLLDSQRKEYILTAGGATPPANVIETERRVILTGRMQF